MPVKTDNQQAFGSQYLIDTALYVLEEIALSQSEIGPIMADPELRGIKRLMQENLALPFPAQMLQFRRS